MMVMMTLGN